ncbi:MAG: response regulator transcription factor [Oligoflexia bacterium]|nr:response regulator transcription factor [Oligoflexia bacterium]
MTKKYKILYIDDEVTIRKLLFHLFTANGYAPYEAASGEEGLNMAASQTPDIIILDLDLPDIKGDEVLVRIREWSKTPIIVLTANKEDDDKVKLLDLGADDYLIKPFHPPELLARIRVAIRHLERNQELPLLTFGELSIDLAGHEVKVRGFSIKLTSKEFDFFKILALNAGRIVTQTQILKTIWGPNNQENSHYLRVYVAQLRKKVEMPLGKKIIITEAGIGYRLLL